MDLKQTVRRALSAACCAAAFAAIPCGAAEPQWILNNESAINRVRINQGTLQSENGTATIIPTGADVSVDPGMEPDEQFSAEERPFFALQYKAKTTKSIGGIFYTNDGNLKSMGDESFSSFPVYGDDAWHNVVMDMRETDAAQNWTGTITSFRLDPLNPSDKDSVVRIARLGFFESEDDAETFLKASKNIPDLDEEKSQTRAAEPQWILNNGPAIKHVWIGQGTLRNEFGLATIIPSGSDVTVDLGMGPDEQFKAGDRPFFALRYKAKTTKTMGGIFYTNDENLKSMSDESFSPFPVSGDDEWHNVVMDMRETSHAKNWRGTIASFRLDPLNPSDTESVLQISRLGFFESEETANNFLDAANDAPDFSQETELEGGFFRCFLPAGSVKPGFDRESYFLTEDSLIAAEKAPNRNTVVVMNGDEIAPLSDASSHGFVTYCVANAGQWHAVDTKTELPADAKKLANANDVLFVVARNLMTARPGFMPKSAFTADDFELLQIALAPYASEGKLGKRVEALLAQMKSRADQKAYTREEAATEIADGIREILNTSVKSPYPAEYFTRDRIRIGSWANFKGADVDDEYMKTYADCGFDFLLSFMNIPTQEQLRLCDKYGVEATVNDDSYRNPIPGSREYWDHPSFTGCYVTDEPGSDDYDKLATLCNHYARETGKRAYVNLLPMYANAAQLKYGAGAAEIEYYDADPDLFRKYCSTFCDKFDTDYICTDIYPFNWVRNKKVTYADYCESINIIASVAREYKRDFWCYIQTFAWIKSKRTPNESEFRWQCYSMLSFGCKTILCWTYAGYQADFPSLVDINSKKTRSWYEARPVFHELRRISDEFVQYKNLGAFSHNCTDATPYLKFSNEYKDFDAIQEIDCPEPLLVGCFDKKNPGDDARGKAFTLVNMSDLEDAKGTTVRVKLDENLQSEVVAWYRGVPEKREPAVDGFYEFHLDSGEGVFVTIR